MSARGISTRSGAGASDVQQLAEYYIQHAVCDDLRDLVWAILKKDDESLRRTLRSFDSECQRDRGFVLPTKRTV